MSIKKISDIKDAIQLNQYDTGSAYKGLSSMYAKDILEGKETTLYAAPSDADDLSRCIVVIECFKNREDISNEEKIEKLDELRATSSAWEGILNSYTHLKNGLAANKNFNVMSEELRAAIKSSVALHISEEKMKAAKAKITGVEEKQTKKEETTLFKTKDIHLANAYILEACQRGYHGTCATFDRVSGSPKWQSTRAIRAHLKQPTAQPILLDLKRDQGRQFSIQIFKPNEELKKAARVRRVPRSNEGEFERGKKSFAKGERSDSLTVQLKHYSLWKKHKSSNRHSTHLKEATSMLEQLSLRNK